MGEVVVLVADFGVGIRYLSYLYIGRKSNRFGFPVKENGWELFSLFLFASRRPQLPRQVVTLGNLYKK